MQGPAQASSIIEKKHIQEYIKTLDEESAQVLCMHYGLNGQEEHSMRDIAAVMNASHGKEWSAKDIRSILVKAADSLESSLGSPAPIAEEIKGQPISP